MIRVSISHEELAIIEECVAGFVTAHAARGNPSYYYTEMSDDHHETKLVGTLGETAVKLHFGIDWLPDVFNDGPDVGVDIEVRATRRPDGNLITTDRDRPGRYVLARVLSNRLVELVGWTTLDKANVPSHQRNGHRRFYLTPADELEPIETLTLWRTI